MARISGASRLPLLAPTLPAASTRPRWQSLAPRATQSCMPGLARFQLALRNRSAASLCQEPAGDGRLARAGCPHQSSSVAYTSGGWTKACVRSLAPRPSGGKHGAAEECESIRRSERVVAGADPIMFAQRKSASRDNGQQSYSRHFRADRPDPSSKPPSCRRSNSETWPA